MPNIAVMFSTVPSASIPMISPLTAPFEIIYAATCFAFSKSSPYVRLSLPLLTAYLFNNLFAISVNLS